MGKFLPSRNATIILMNVIFAAFAMQTASADPVLEAYYRGDVMHNADGGIKTGSAYLDDMGLTFSAEIGSLFDANEASVFVYLLHNNRATFSDVYVGDLQVVSNIDSEQGTRIYELWYEQRWSDTYSLRVGLYDLNSEFDAIDTAGLFMNSSHGIGGEYAQSGENGPSIFPVTSMAVRFDWALNDASILRLAVLDGVPGDPDDISKTEIKFSSDEGVLTALEYNYVMPGGTRFAAGGWLYSADFDEIDGGRGDGNAGVYGFVDAPLLASEPSGLAINGFLRYGVANDDINAIDSYFGAGLVATGLLQQRPDDQFGIAFANVQIGSPFKQAVEDAGGSVDSRESKIEMTYSTQVNDWLRLQPNLQYVMNPGADPALDDALVIGVQFELTAGYDWN